MKLKLSATTWQSRIFCFQFNCLQKIEFSKKLISNFFQKPFSKNFFFFLKKRLCQVIATGLLYILTPSRGSYLENCAKNLGHTETWFLTLNVRITPAKLNILGSSFYCKLSKVKHISSKNFSKIECSGKKIDFWPGGGP